MDLQFSLTLSPPMAVRALNAALSPVASKIDLSEAAFLARARKETGLYDLGGDPSAEERLQALCRAADESDSLSPFGRIALGIFFHFHLTDRLRIVHQIAKKPAVLDVPVEAPIFIVGWYRTGTTLLHNLLAADTRHRAPRTWELVSPSHLSSDPARDRRLRTLRSEVILQLSRYLVPESAAAHYVPIDGPEECFFLLENDFVSSTMFNTYGAYDYAQWLLEQDLRPSYRFMREQLQLLSHGQPERRWVLKCPFHLWHLEALLDAFPDARFIFTHRDVAEALPSNCSLSAMTTSKFAKRTDLAQLGEFWRSYYAEGLRRAAVVRAKLPPERFIDVPLPWVASKPIEAVESIYRRFDIDMPPATREAIMAALRHNPKQTHGKHRYAPSQFGLDAEQLHRDFAEYHDFYLRLLGRHGLGPARGEDAAALSG